MGQNFFRSSELFRPPDVLTFHYTWRESLPFQLARIRRHCRADILKWTADEFHVELCRPAADNHLRQIIERHFSNYQTVLKEAASHGRA